MKFRLLSCRRHVFSSPSSFGKRVLCAVLFVGMGLQPSHAQAPLAVGPATRPILRIEAGMHTAPIHRIDVDAQGRYLVTGSEDKTVRVWSLPEGKLLRVLRPPVGEGNEGKVNAVAISPDGRLIACGGWTGYEWDKSRSLYLFDRESGSLVRRIPGLPNVVFDLCFSRDGRLVAAGMGGNSGVRVFRTETGEPVMVDTEYGNSSLGVDFDATGRLVTTSLDGYVRLYGADLKPVAKVKAPGGTKPIGVRFSPDGSRIAVGYDDTPRVLVLSGAELSLLYEPANRYIKSGGLSAVSWSFDGEILYAAGTAKDIFGRTFIRNWSEGGRGKAYNVDVAHATVMDLRLQPGASANSESRIAFASAEPRFGIFAMRVKDSQISYSHAPLQTAPVPDYRGVGDSFRLNADASSVQFLYRPQGTAIQLSVPSRSLLVEEAFNKEPGSLTRPPLIQTEGLHVANWLDTDKPLRNGRALLLEPYEISRSLALTPDRQSFLLGTEYYVRCYDKDGRLRWRVPAPGICWAVNVAGGNGNVGVAAFGDGTIRWYRMQDGKELLVFFLHTDWKRWVLWTPSGYYDCSPGGEELIGWHLNQGKDQAAEFHPASRFRDVYYRPDVIKHILATLNEEKALALANENRSKPDAAPIPLEKS